jgi:hypothetical protein
VKRIQFFCFMIFMLLFSTAQAQFYPSADTTTSGLFLGGSGYEIPANYFVKENLQKAEGGTDSYVLKSYPTNASGSHVTQLGVWNSSLLALINYPSYYNEFLVGGFPSFSEYNISRGQCVAFAKVATNTEGYGTNRWYAAEHVMTQVDPRYPPGTPVYQDNSWMYRGRMVAYFGANGATGSQYPQTASSPGHVGVFLKFAYQNVVPPLVPIGFWIADENYEGNATSTNPDGKIRKHLILFSPPNRPNGTAPLGHAYANRYYFVKIQ